MEKITTVIFRISYILCILLLILAGLFFFVFDISYAQKVAIILLGSSGIILFAGSIIKLIFELKQGKKKDNSGKEKEA